MGVVLRPSGGLLEVSFTGVDVLLGLLRSRRVPLSAVRSVEVVPVDEARRRTGWRVKVAGSRVPGLVQAGTFGTGASRELWCWHREPRVVVVDLAGQHHARWVLGVTDPDTVAGRVRDALPAP